MQLPMMNLMLCLFVLLVMMLTGEEGWHKSDKVVGFMSREGLTTFWSST